MRERLGLPDIGGHRRFVLAMALDAIGSGVFMPVSILYFTATTSLSLARVGLALSIAGAVAAPGVLVVGSLVDRYGPKPIAVLSNVVQAVGFLGYLVAQSFPAVLLAMAVTALGQAMFWGSFTALVGAIAPEGERERWFGFLGALRNVGFAVGGIVGGVAVSVGTPGAYHATVLANAASYAVVVLLLAGLAVAPVDREPGAGSGWGQALRDRPYGLLVATNLAYAMAMMALNVAMPVYAARLLHLPGWVVGAIFVVNTVLVGVLQGPAVAQMTGHRRWRIVVLGQLVLAGSFGLMALLGVASREVAAPAILGVVAVYTLGEIISGPVLSTLAVEAAPTAARGRYLSLYQLSWTVSGIVVPAAYTALLERGRYPVWLALIAISAAGALLAARLPAVLPEAERVVPAGSN